MRVGAACHRVEDAEADMYGQTSVYPHQGLPRHEVLPVLRKESNLGRSEEMTKLYAMTDDELNMVTHALSVRMHNEKLIATRDPLNALIEKLKDQWAFQDDGRYGIGKILERVAQDRLPEPRDVDVAIDAIISEIAACGKDGGVG